MEDNIIIDYEEIFNDKKVKINPPSEDEQKNSSVFTILLYAILFFLGGSTMLIAPFFKTKDANFLLLEQATIIENQQDLYIIDNESYLNSSFNIDEQYIVSISNYTYINYYDDFDKVWLTENINQILKGDIKYWPKDESSDDDVIITIYITGETNLNISNENTYIVKSGYSINQKSIMTFLSYIIVIIPLVVLNFKKIRYDFTTINIQVEKPFIANLFSSLLIMYALSIGLITISNGLAKLLNMSSTSSNQQAINLMLNSKYAVLVVITVSLIGPLVEELVFRSAIFSLVKDSKKAIIVSSITFGLIHITTELIGLVGMFSWFAVGQMLIFSISYIGMGVYLSYLYHKNNHNIVLLYAVHGLYNLIVAVLGFLL